MACGAVAVLAAVVVMVGGCGQLDVVEGLTPEKAQAETARLVDEAIGKIDPALIKRIDDVTDEPLACYGSDVDPNYKVQAWYSTKVVVLIDGAQQVDIANPVIQSYIDAGWTVTYDQEATKNGGRTVQLMKDGAPGLAFGVHFSVDANDQPPAEVLISATSPCFNDPSR